MGLLVGAASGLAAFLFLLALDGFSQFCTRTLMGISLATPAGEEFDFGLPVALHPRRWLILLLPAAGAFLSGLVTRRFAPEAAGDGMDASIRAFHEDAGKVPMRVGLVKCLGSILTVGAGGSSGREGPIAQISTGIGSSLAKLFRLSDRERRVFMLSGMAAGIGAIFRSPLGGAISAVEILYKEDFESSALVPCVVSSVTAYTVFRMLLALPGIGIPDTASMYALPALELSSHQDVLFAGALGVGCALFGRLYVKIYQGCRNRLFPALPLPEWLKPLLGGLGVGLIALFFLDVLGTGGGVIQKLLHQPLEGLAPRAQLALAASFLVLALLKMLATSLTIGSGGSGGVFGPTLVIGGLLGAAAGGLAHALLPQWQPPSLAAFVLFGMAGFFAGVASASIGAVIMVCEMTGSYTMLAPLLTICVVTILLSRNVSLYRNQVANRFTSPAYRNLMLTDLLAGVTVDSCYHRTIMPTIPENATARDLRKLLADENVPFPLTVTDRHQRPCGILTMGGIRPVYFEDADPNLFLVKDMMLPLTTCTGDESLAAALRKFDRSGYSRLPVVSATNPAELLGYLQYQDLLTAYEAELAKRRLQT
jgi:CIC family chloride channel protein